MQYNKFPRNYLAVFTFLIIFSILLPISLNTGVKANFDVAEIVPESNDFATQVLNDPWDMQEFTDISQRLNYAGATNDLLNINVSNGVFSATTEGSYSEFFPLFSGWNPAVLHGKIGELNPIDSTKYQCFYMSMKTDKRIEFHVFAAKDRDFLLGIDSNEAFETYWNFSEVSDFYRLQKIDLAQSTNHFYRKWTDLPEWKVFRVNPVLNSVGTNFSVDWIRLTDCKAVNLTITGVENQKAYDVWLDVGSPARTVLAESGLVSNGSGQLLFDTQGLEAGAYTYTIKDAGKETIRTSGQFVVNAQPQVDILRPSPTYGEDFATSKGAAWDMSGNESTWGIRNVGSYAFDQGSLKLYTNSGSTSNVPDPIVFLSIPDQATPADYRYLSFRMYQNGNVAEPGEGMIARWAWITRFSTGGYCTFIGLDIPLEVGWNTYVIDLYTDNNGRAVQSDYCSSSLKPWREFTEKNANFRFDPNENISGFQYYQEIDWIKLTKVDRSTSGEVYTIEYIPSEENLQSLVFYYTDDLSNPKKHLAIEYNPPSETSDPAGPYFVYLPIVLKNPVTYEYPIYRWNTNGVVSGEYYICSVSNDGYNEAIDCSEAPLIIE